MDIKMLFESAGVELSPEVVTKFDESLTALIESKVEETTTTLTEKFNVETETLKTELAEQYDQKVESEKATLIEQVDSYVSHAVEEALAIHEAALVQTDEYSRMTKVFNEVKTTFERYGFDISESTVVEEATANVEALNETVSSLLEKNSSLKAALREAEETIVFEHATAGLTEMKKEKVKKLAENIEWSTVAQLSEKLKVIVEEISTIKPEKDEKPKSPAPEPDSKMSMYISKL